MTGRTLTKWDFRFLQMAEVIAGWSKDPSTRVGAVIVRPDRTIASLDVPREAVHAQLDKHMDMAASVRAAATGRMM